MNVNASLCNNFTKINVIYYYYFLWHSCFFTGCETRQQPPEAHPPLPRRRDCVWRLLFPRHLQQQSLPPQLHLQEKLAQPRLRLQQGLLRGPVHRRVHPKPLHQQRHLRARRQRQEGLPLRLQGHQIHRWVMLFK